MKTDLPTEPAKPSVFSVKLDKLPRRKHKHFLEDSSRLLSAVYALVVTLIGLLLPLTEALQNIWHETIYNLVFQIVILTIAVAFLFYFQLHLVPMSKEDQKVDQKSLEDPGTCQGSLEDPESCRGSLRQSRTQNNLKSDQEHRRKPPVFIKSKDRKILGRVLENASAVIHHNNSPATKHRPEKRKDSLRISVSASDLQKFGVDNKNENIWQIASRNNDSTSVFNEDIRHEEDEEEAYIDLQHMGNMFSHEGSSLYVRLGALVFSICNIVFIALEIENSSRLRNIPECSHALAYWWIFIFRLVFLIIQSFFIFKNMKISISYQTALARFGFMHLIATNMCVWLQTVINEIMEQYHMEITEELEAEIHYTKPHNDHSDHYEAQKTHSDASDHYEASTLHEINVTEHIEDGCHYYTGMIHELAPYLFPFVLEYSLIAIGTIAVTYISIDNRDKAIKGLCNWIHVQKLKLDPGTPEGNVSSDAAVSESGIQLLKSHRGLFAGMLLLASNFVAVVLFYYSPDKDFIYYVTDLVVHTILLVAAIGALYKTNQLSYIPRPVSIDDVLLFVAMAGAFLFELTLSLSSSGYISDYLHGKNHDLSHLQTEVFKLCSAVIAMLQTLIQVILIVSGTRRYPSSQEHLRDMPGRGTVTFLVTGNVTVWLSRTFQAKKLRYLTEMKFFGVLASLLLLDVNLPLLYYFRFHSSICLADIWTSAYTPLHTNISPKAPDRSRSPPQASPAIERSPSAGRDSKGSNSLGRGCKDSPIMFKTCKDSPTMLKGNQGSPTLGQLRESLERRNRANALYGNGNLANKYSV